MELEARSSTFSTTTPDRHRPPHPWPPPHLYGSFSLSCLIPQPWPPEPGYQPRLQPLSSLCTRKAGSLELSGPGGDVCSNGNGNQN